MIEVIRAREIAAPPSDVWRVLADFGAISSWAENVDHSCVISESTEGVGAVRRIQTGRNTVLERVVAWEPPAVLSYSIEGLPPVVQSVTNTWRVVAEGDGSWVALTTTITPGPRPPHQVAARVVGRVLGKASDQMLDGLSSTSLAPVGGMP